METYFLFLSLLFATAWTSQGQTSGSSISYQTSELFLSTSFNVYQISRDLRKDDGSILFTTYGALQSSDGQTVTPLASISFASLTGFKQLDKNRVVIVVNNQHCLKLFSRVTNSLSTLAGTCGSRGYREGAAGWGLMQYPESVEIDIKNPGRLLVTDSSNQAIRSVDLETGVLRTVIRSGFDYPRGMIWFGDTLLITNLHYISQVTWSSSEDDPTNEQIIGSSSQHGIADGSFSTAQFESPNIISKLTESLYLVTDYNFEGLKLLDFKNEYVGPVCFQGESPCEASSELPSELRSVHVDGDDVYIGASQNIYKLSGPKLPSAKADSCSYDNMTAYLEPCQPTVKVQLHGGDMVELPLGNYQFTRRDNSTNCTYHVAVTRSPVSKRLVFRSEYDIMCASLNTGADTSFLHSVLAQRREELQDICLQDCTMSSTLQPWYECERNVLTVYWPTDTLLSASSETLPVQLNGELERRLSGSAAMHLSYIGIISHNPPLIAARESNGKGVEITLVSSCTDGSKEFDARQGICV